MPGDAETPPRRSVSQWLILLLAWAIGLAIWVMYLAVLGYLLLVVL